MKTFSTWRTTIVLAGLLGAVPAAVRARQVQVVALEPTATLTATRCLAGPPPHIPAWDAVAEALVLDRDAAKARLVDLEDSVSALAAARPDDVNVQFLLAAVLGARAELEGGRTKMRIAEKLLDRLSAVLALEPEHAGALDMMGRLHAAVMRMDWLTRVVATRILGGAELRSASWEEAERLLESAIAAEPCVGDHYYQLASVYADRGKRALALDRLNEFFELGPTADVDPRVYGLATTLKAELNGS